MGLDGGVAEAEGDMVRRASGGPGRSSEARRRRGGGLPWADGRVAAQRSGSTAGLGGLADRLGAWALARPVGCMEVLSIAATWLDRAGTPLPSFAQQFYGCIQIVGGSWVRRLDRFG